MMRPVSTLLSPPDPSELLVLERVLLKLGQFNQLLIMASPSLRSALEGRGLIAATCLMVSAAAQAEGIESTVQPLDLYCGLYGVSVPGRPDWAMSTRARHLALKLDQALQLGEAARPASWLRLAPALPPADSADPTPRLFRALEVLRLACLTSRRQVECWGTLPFALVSAGLTPLPVPALTLTHQRLRLERFDPVLLRLRLLDRLDRQLGELLGLASRLVRDHALMMVRLRQAPKAATLGRLADLLLKLPLVTPKLVSDLLGLDLSTAGRLCARATELELLKPITHRASWKVYGAALVQDRYGNRLGLHPTSQATTRAAPAPIRQLMEDVDALLAAMGPEKR
jgi:hypothetical protein